MARTKTNPAETKALVSWQDELAADAKAIAATEPATGGNFISFKGGVLTYKNQQLPGNAIDVVVLDHVFENGYYEGAYDPKNPASPICYGYGRTEKDMVPHPECENAQHSDCASCPANAWGSAGRGNAKACKNGRRLACVMAEDLDDLENAEIFFAKIPPTGIRPWAGYVSALDAQLKRPPYGVVTRIVVLKTSEAFELKFEYVQETTEEKIATAKMIQAIKSKREAAQAGLTSAYPKTSERETPAKGKGAKFQASGVAAKAGKFVPKGR